MRLSVIVTVYNIDPYLPRCVESILTQDYRDYELILVDDGSTDKAGAICDEYAQRDSRIRVIHKENGGVTSARKAGSEIACGEYVTVIDGDDCIGEGYLRDIVQAIENSHADLLLWNGRIREAGEEIFCFNRCEQGFYDAERIRELRDRFFYDAEAPGMNRGQILFSVCPTAVRRSIFVSCQREIDERILEGEDVLLLWRILNIAQSAYVCGIDRYYYCPRPSSATQKLHKNRILSHKLLEKALLGHPYDGKDVENRMNVFLLFNLCMLIEKFARNSRYPAFRRFIDYCEKEKIFGCVDKATIAMPTKGERAKQLLLQHRMWLILYLYYRSRQVLIRDKVSRKKGGRQS